MPRTSSTVAAVALIALAPAWAFSQQKPPAPAPMPAVGPAAEILAIWKDIGRKLITMKWVQGSSFTAFELGLQVMASGRYPLGEISTHQYDLNHVNEAIRAFAGEEGPSGVIHVSIRPEV